MHTLKIVGAGLALLALLLIVGWAVGASRASGVSTAVKVFVPLWFVGAAINMWFGVTRAGYSVADEAPVFVLVFAIPVVIALLARWLLLRAVAS